METLKGSFSRRAVTWHLKLFTLLKERQSPWPPFGGGGRAAGPPGARADRLIGVWHISPNPSCALGSPRGCPLGAGAARRRAAWCSCTPGLLLPGT